jgi:hypothetical protein
MRIDAMTLARLVRIAPGEDERKAAAVLGPDHALARLLARRRALTCQILVTSITLALGLAGAALQGNEALTVLVAAGVVEVALLVAVPYFRGRTRDVTQQLIAAGEDESVAVGAVRDERRRLASRKERERFARSLERLLHDAERWYRILPAYRPPDGAQFLRYAAAEAREVVALLRTEGAHVRGVALTARFLMDGYSSPLYAGDVGRLREELNRIRYLLTPDNTPFTVRAAA